MECKDNLFAIPPLKVKENKVPSTSKNTRDDVWQFIPNHKLKEGSTPIKFFHD